MISIFFNYCFKHLLRKKPSCCPGGQKKSFEGSDGGIFIEESTQNNGYYIVLNG